ncbi:1932_t:CDS:2 [Paraglomus brasilianum]|uniref:1932_t:CDS:1 n=1 Tax=Paraglomus brasilianum TaxID=144538 RepID=A0A9N9B215_9GLOM|nr:1932_t:CDS:2 [Paraglomus brasilianum]
MGSFLSTPRSVPSFSISRCSRQQSSNPRVTASQFPTGQASCASGMCPHGALKIPCSVQCSSLSLPACTLPPISRLSSLRSSLRSSSPYGACPACSTRLTSPGWCSPCECLSFTNSFPLWHTGSALITRLIRQIQLSATGWDDYVDWIPWDCIQHVKFYSEGVYGRLYKGYITKEHETRWIKWRFENEIVEVTIVDGGWKIDSDNETTGIGIGTDTVEYVGQPINEWINEDRGTGVLTRPQNAYREKSSLSDDDFMYDSDIVEKSRTMFFEVEHNDQSSIDESLDEYIDQADESEDDGEIRPYLHCTGYDGLLTVFGVTRDPVTKRYLLVLETAYLSLRTCLYAPNDEEIKKFRRRLRGRGKKGWTRCR